MPNICKYGCGLLASYYNKSGDPRCSSHFNQCPANRVEGGYHLDHIVPLKYAYLNNLPIAMVCHPNNLRMIPWEENIRRKTKDENEMINNKIIELSQLV